MSFRIFPALFDKPLKMKFVDQDPDEHIELLLRQHWITNISWIIIATLLLFVPLLVFNIFFRVDIIPISKIPVNIISAGLILWYLMVVAYAAQHFLYWYFNIYIVTDKHLVEVDFEDLFNKKVTQIRLDDIQSSQAKMQGMAQSMFNFGDVAIETAAKTEFIGFEDIPQPDFVADRIQVLQGKAQGGNNNGI